MTVRLAVRLILLAIACGMAGLASAESPTIENTDWTLAALGGSPLTTWQAQTAVRFRLDASTKRMEGIAGCNHMAGGYRLDGAHLSFSGVATTRMYCGERTMELESAVLSALAATTGYRTTDGRLELYGGQRVLGAFQGGAAGGEAAPAARFANRVWRVAPGSSIPPGQLYVFLSQGTLLIASSHGRPAIDSWAYRDGTLSMTEAGLTYRVKILGVSATAFSIEVSNPGQPTEIHFVLAAAPGR